MPRFDNLPVGDDGGPDKPDDTNPPSDSLGDTDEWLKSLFAEMSDEDIDRMTPTMTAEEELNKAEVLYEKGFLTEFELNQKKDVIAKVIKLREMKYIDDDEYQHAIHNNGFFRACEIPKPEELRRK